MGIFNIACLPPLKTWTTSQNNPLSPTTDLISLSNPLFSANGRTTTLSVTTSPSSATCRSRTPNSVSLPPSPPVATRNVVSRRPSAPSLKDSSTWSWSPDPETTVRSRKPSPSSSRPWKSLTSSPTRTPSRSSSPPANTVEPVKTLPVSVPVVLPDVRPSMSPPSDVLTRLSTSSAREPVNPLSETSNPPPNASPTRSSTLLRASVPTPMPPARRTKSRELPRVTDEQTYVSCDKRKLESARVPVPVRVHTP